MIYDAVKLFFLGRKQNIESIVSSKLPIRYRGVPDLDLSGLTQDQRKSLENICPVHAINSTDLSLDMGKCLFCGECQNAFPGNIKFSNDWKIWGFNRKDLIVRDRVKWRPPVCEKPFSIFQKTLRMRQLCAGGDMGCELELGACSNVNFDMERFGMSFTASPRHADALVVSGPITRNMSDAAESTFSAIPDPKVLIAVGTDVISGGLFADSEETDRTFFQNHKPDLYVAGATVHPLNFISAVAALTGRNLP